METNTSKFLKVFDPSDQKHVLWFKKMTDLCDKMADPSAAMTLNAEINLNPMRIELDHRDTLDWFHIHFVLCGKYAKAVLNGTAWIPPKSN
jgi:hypothetical protein